MFARNERETLKRAQPRQYTIEKLEDRRVLAVFSVDNLADSGSGSLRTAIFEANTTPGPDEIVFAEGVSGTISLARQLEIRDSLTILGPGPDLLTIDAGNGFDGVFATGDGGRIFDVNDNRSSRIIDVALSGMTLTGGDTQDGTDGIAVSSVTWPASSNDGRNGGNGRAGGAIRSFENLTIENVVVSENATGDGGQGGQGGSVFGAFATVFPGSGGDGGDGGSGGAIAALSGSLIVINSTISDNATGSPGSPSPGGLTFQANTNNLLAVGLPGQAGQRGNGGGIFSLVPTHIDSSSIVDNSSLSGGGIYTEADSTTIRSTIFRGNTALHGGGIHNENALSQLHITDSIIESNIARGGGAGILLASGSAAVVGSTVADNAAGGGIFALEESSLTIDTSTISGNRSEQPSSSGGIRSRGDVAVLNSTVSGNRAEGDESLGGGLAVDGQLRINHSTITDNFSNDVEADVQGGGGIRALAGGDILNSIIAGNSTASGIASDVLAGSGAPPSVNFSLTGDSADSNLDLLVGNGNIFDVDPLLGPLDDNGGRTFTHALLEGSPAIDAGSFEGFSSFKDQRGSDRVSDGNGDWTPRIDIGAAEQQVTIEPEVISDREEIFTLPGDEFSVGGEPGTSVFEWTSPSSGLATIRGNLWNTNLPNEDADYWRITLNDELLTTGVLVGDDNTEDSPFAFIVGSGGIGSLTGLEIEAGDVVQLAINSDSEDVLGVEFDVSLNPTGIPEFTIGEIPNQFHSANDPTQFIVKSLDSPDDELGMQVFIGEPQGELSFDPSTGLVQYTPTAENDFEFTLLFDYSDDGEFDPLKTQFVTLGPPIVEPEFEVIGADNSDELDPESSAYFTVIETVSERSRIFNARSLAETRSVQISGKTIVFEPDHSNGLFERFVFGEGEQAGNRNITDITIAAETVIIAGHAHFPQTDVTIFAKEVIFEDKNGVASKIETTPLGDWAVPASASDSRQAENGRDGGNAGDLDLQIRSLIIPEGESEPRFVLHGGDGQEAGQGRRGIDGTPRSTPSDCTETVILQRLRDEGFSTFVNGIDNYPEGRDVHYVYVLDDGEEIAICNSRADLPEDGTKADPGGDPGNGGDGGFLTSSFPIGSRLISAVPGTEGDSAADQPGGIRGRPGSRVTEFQVAQLGLGFWLVNPESIQSRTPQDGEGWIASEGVPGRNGSFEVSTTRSEAWLQPAALEAMVSFANDTYLVGNLAEAEILFTDIGQTLDSLRPFNLQFTADFDRLHADVNSQIHQLANGLDFFGNPLGWAPSLSFAANLQAFDNQIDVDVQTIFLAQLIQDISADTESKVATIDRTLVQLDENVDLAISTIRDTQPLISNLETELASIVANTESIETRIAEREVILERQARENLEPPGWKQALDFIGPILQAVPVPVVSGIGTGISVASTVLTEIDNGEWAKAAEAASGFKKAYSSDTLKKTREELDSQLDLLKPPSKASKGEIFGYVGDLAKLGKKYAPAIKAVSNALKGSEIPADALAKELERLKTNDPQLTDLIDDVSELNGQKMVFAQKVTELEAVLNDSVNRLNSAYASANALSIERRSAIAELRPETLQAAKRMEQDARDRLLSFQYRMAKSFEYEFGQPFDGDDFLLQDLFDAMTEVIEGGVDAGFVDSGAPFDDLTAVFRQSISEIAEGIFSRLNDSALQLTTTINYRLSDAELAALNDAGSLELNFLDLGIVDPSWEDARILDIQINDVSASVSNPSAQTANVRFEVLQPEQSVIQLAGRRLLFNHPDESAGEDRWAADFDALSGNTPIQAEIDPSDLASLAILLDQDFTNIDDDFAARLLSAPSAQSTFELRTETTVVPSATRVDLEAATVSVQLVFDRNDLVSLELDVRNDLTPRINISPVDEVGFDDASGSTFRFFQRGTEVTLSAQPQLGLTDFVHWRNSGGEVFSRDPTIRIELLESERVEAVYALPGDLDFNGQNGFSDFLTLSASFGSVDAIWADGDFDGDGVVGFADFLLLSQNFGLQLSS